MECHQTEIVLKSLGRAKCDCLDMHQLFVFYLFCFFFISFLKQTKNMYINGTIECDIGPIGGGGDSMNSHTISTVDSDMMSVLYANQ